MADASHLERMGRELKCPICLSLLHSAVSLTCNHAFCNSCIDKSMKAASNCPVCKVPFRRREIRPAPHMDNLVSVYKSMELASGVNIFITQNAPSTKIAGEDNQTAVNSCEAQQDRAQTQVALGSENQKQCQQKRSKSATANQKSSGSNSMKPSFPTKKRVQVPLYPTSETLIEPGNLEVGSVENDRKEPEKCPVSQKDISSISEKGKPLFSPFFWLREDEDLEKSSQQTDDNQLMYTPPDAPCFSDIKDSDDEVPCKISPKSGACVLSDNADFIDSEMFDWTQRPCSPELCSNPLAMQIEHTTAHNGAQENAEVALIETATISPNNRESLAKKRMADKISDNKGGARASNKKVSNANETRKGKRAKKSMCEVTAVHSESDKETYQDMQEGNKDNTLTLKRKPRKNKKVCSEASIQEKNLLALSDGIELLANSNETALHVSEDRGKRSEGSINSKKIGENKSTKKTLAQPHKLGSKVKTRKFETGIGHICTEQYNEVLISQLHTNLLPSGNDKEFSDRGITGTYETNSKKKISKSGKKVKFCVEGMSMDNCDGILSSANDQDAMRGQTFQEIQSATDQSGTNFPAKMDKAISPLNSRVLHKCTSPSTFCCAFCQSSQESEASGTMVHYLNGKLVADNHNARTNAIHVHKSCAEWAPNVYFEDDNVMNLQAELSRSRRIRCSCCGIKGAALGCYEKSCRRSFHVTCAKLMPECRWDCENFVMLCPIHASCQLPNEMLQSKSKQKRKSVAERKSCTHQVEATDGCKGRSALQWKSQKKFKNLVLCCSALTNTEKAIVTEFENLSGVTILKNWDSSVTHVLASADEDGACKRTLKFLMGVLEGKWILSVQWINACMEAGELVDEQPYEISIDIHGVRDGPRLGRLRLLNKRPKLFDGCTFFFMGDFVPSYKGYLHDLVIAAGGKVLNRKPVAGGQATTFIIYSLELPDQPNGSSVLNQRRAHAKALASSAGAVAASNSWILNSIAGHTLQKIAE